MPVKIASVHKSRMARLYGHGQVADMALGESDFVGYNVFVSIRAVTNDYFSNLLI